MSGSDKNDISYQIGQDLYTASRDEMRDWITLLKEEIYRLETEIEKKMQDQAAADAIFK